MEDSTSDSSNYIQWKDEETGDLLSVFGKWFEQNWKEPTTTD